ncbi:MAG: amino acid ABC transporter permease [Deltaproteobacteria bacterium]|nr:amino acid ABC transporter permease [Deltaproteobacteria bacterium]
MQTFDICFIFTVTPDILRALPLTMMILVLSLVFGTILGLLTTVMKLRKKPVSSFIATAYVSFIRGTPPLLQLYLIYYGLPKILEIVGININDWDKVFFAIVTYSLNSGAFLSEVMRSAYLSVDIGQQEAAFSIGMGNIQTLKRIIFPQAFAIALPNLGNSIIQLFKETSLAFIIGVNDIMGQAQLIIARGYGVRQFETFIAVSLIYWAICIVMEKSFASLERIYKKGHIEIAG